MPVKKFTHRGMIKGISACAPKDYKEDALLRETKLFWVTRRGLKYKKATGYPPDSDWLPDFMLDLSTIEELPECELH